MKISAVKLKNIKGFQGTCLINNLDDYLSSERNIILFGGYNGAGKTTLLESLYLCFYGALATKLYPSKGAKHENYNALITSILNKNVKASGGLMNEMEVEVFLKDVKLTSNFPRNISLRRTWEIQNNGTYLDIKNEDFLILENEKPIDELDKNEYQDRILALLPYSVSQFFFFDGEKIEDFAADADNEFATSLKDVLGINLYSTLSNDLRSVRQRILGDYNKNKEADHNLKLKEAELSELLKKLEDNQLQVGELTEKINEKEIEREKIEAQTSRLTRRSTEGRTSIQKEKELLEFEKETLIKDYIETSEEYLPFILSSDLCEELENQLTLEEKYLNWQAAQKEIEPKIDNIINAVFDDNPSPPKPDITFIQKEFYRNKIDKVIRKEIFNSEDSKFTHTQLIHNLSSNDILKIKKSLNTYSQEIVNLLHTKSEKLKQIEIRLGRINQTESKSGDKNEDIQKLFDDIKNLSDTIGGLKEKIKQLIDEDNGIERKLEVVRREITSWESKVGVKGKQKKQMEYCEKLQQVISDFQMRFQTQKTTELQNAILEMWNKLAQKENQIKQVVIYPEKNFEVKLFDEMEMEIDKTKLSAGEKEIFAISLLDALIKVLGKDFPIIIDTPFGRLDSKHRTNIVKHYFPNASHQVILLSQDEEIIGQYYKILKPHLAKELTITYDNKTKRSTVSDGYPFSRAKEFA